MKTNSSFDIDANSSILESGEFKNIDISSEYKNQGFFLDFFIDVFSKR